MQQTITPNPHIPCKPGWCLAYVNQAFRVPIRFGSATAAWNGSATKHRDSNFPVGVWTPLWFSLKTEPNGHAALLAPDGRVFSTTHPTALWPTVHPNLAHLISAYAQYNPLTYLGWTEDVEGTRVMAPSGLSPQGNITPITTEENPLADFTPEQIKQLVKEAIDGWSMDVRRFKGDRNILDTFAQEQAEHKSILDAVNAIPAKVLFENRVDGRNLIDWQKQIRADIVNVKPGTSVDIPELAKALSAQLEAKDIKALAAQLQITVKEG